MRKSISWAAGLTCAGLALSSMLVGGAASAHSEENALVLGQDQNLGGINWSFTARDPDLSGDQGGDRASSIKNDDSRAWVVYEHDTFGGRGYCINTGIEEFDLHRSIMGFGDKISSVRRLGTSSCAGYPSFIWR